MQILAATAFVRHEQLAIKEGVCAMDEVVKPAEPQEKKPYTAPKLTTHGDVAELTNSQDSQGQDGGSSPIIVLR